MDWNKLRGKLCAVVASVLLCLGLYGCSLDSCTLKLCDSVPVATGKGAPVLLLAPCADERSEDSKECLGRFGSSILGTDNKVLSDPAPAEVMRAGLVQALQEKEIGVVLPPDGTGAGNPGAVANADYTLVWRLKVFSFTKALDEDLIHNIIRTSIEIAWGVRQSAETKDVLSGVARSSITIKVNRPTIIAPSAASGELQDVFRRSVKEACDKVAADIAANRDGSK
jgi:hypothetical protein